MESSNSVVWETVQHLLRYTNESASLTNSSTDFPDTHVSLRSLAVSLDPNHARRRLVTAESAKSAERKGRFAFFWFQALAPDLGPHWINLRIDAFPGFSCCLYRTFVTWKLVLGHNRLAEGLPTRWRPLYDDYGPVRRGPHCRSAVPSPEPTTTPAIVRLASRRGAIRDPSYGSSSTV